MWNQGLKGKSWRILRNLNKDLKAQVNTRYGLTQVIKMNCGGKQGSRLTGRMFSKLMDMLAVEIEPSGEGFHLKDNFVIAYLLWVDDVVSCVDGMENQEKMLKRVQDFATRHKLTWGTAKCKVMRVGRHQKEEKEWTLGDKNIEETSTYRYLGDEVSNDGKNDKNLEARKNKVTACVASINTIASSEVLRRIETAVLLELHEKVVLSALMTNSESWTLSTGNKDELDKIEIQTLKYIFDLPAHTPTPAIIFTLGTLYTRHRVNIKRLSYLHRLLNSSTQAWNRQTLDVLVSLQVGWGKNIIETLEEYDLPTSFDTIKNITKGQWKRTVKAKVEIKNKLRLLNDCYKKEGGEQKPKTKTKHLIELINCDTYSRMTQTELLYCTRQETKTIIISRFGMLECGRNFKGTLSDVCKTCKVLDDESHRMNHCASFKDINLHLNDIKVDFNDIYSSDVNILRKIIPVIEKVWNLTTAHGTIRK